ncbi:MAG TPA: HNH endonuclease [Candidatus Olsenella stercoravium]|uniref:HNH endonuclease n=1 Tax=Candidatus Olsenella stercoravium TaxID=2838713 RepID=A0A9D2DII0_9ACTN|nr:HNH endonuclease [Candidatus Olsenella stercoravium]
MGALADRNPNLPRCEIEASGSSRPGNPQQLGLERVEQVLTRVNQDYFRSVLLSNYGGTCCLTGIDIPALLTASHIKPWAAATPNERLISSNGILLNALHDRAFDRSLITLDDRYRVAWSPRACCTRPRTTSGSTPSTGGRSPCRAATSRPGRASTSSTTTTTASSSGTRGLVLLVNASYSPSQSRLSHLPLNTSIPL